jgi:hypothetical protein
MNSTKTEGENQKGLQYNTIILNGRQNTNTTKNKEWNPDEWAIQYNNLNISKVVLTDRKLYINNRWTDNIIVKIKDKITFNGWQSTRQKIKSSTRTILQTEGENKGGIKYKNLHVNKCVITDSKIYMNLI